jgi:hypothetical protein
MSNNTILLHPEDLVNHKTFNTEAVRNKIKTKILENIYSRHYYVDIRGEGEVFVVRDDAVGTNLTEWIKEVFK